MEPMKRMFTIEAFQDKNLGDGMFKVAADADDDLTNQSDMSKKNRKFGQRQFALFQHSIMMEFKKQIRFQETKRSLGDLACHTLEGFDDVVRNPLTPSACLARDQKQQRRDRNVPKTNGTHEPQDPYKIFREHPCFDPVFMKV